jgi:hypothetical protein
MTNTTQKGKIMKGKFVYIHLRDAVNDEGEVERQRIIRTDFAEMFHDRIEFWSYEKDGHDQIDLTVDGTYSWEIDNVSYDFCTVRPLVFGIGEA